MEDRKQVAVAAFEETGSNGALGDIGIHIVDFTSYGAGLDVAHVFGRLKTFDKAPGNKIGDYDLDANDCFAMTVDFTNGAIGTIQASRTAAGQLDQLRLRVYGEKGSIEMIYDTGRSYLRACMSKISTPPTGATSRSTPWIRTTSASPPRSATARRKSPRSGGPPISRRSSTWRRPRIATTGTKRWPSLGPEPANSWLSCLRIGLVRI